MASSRSLGQLTVDLVAKTGGFEQGMDRAARTADNRMKQIERSAKIAGAAIGSALVGGMALVIRNTVAYERSIGQLDAILKSTGNAAGYARTELEGMARSMSAQSTFAVRDIIDAQTRMLSYSGVVGENLPRAMQAAIDQSTRLGMSLSQSAETIGRALESPSKAAAALAQQGFGAAFTDEVRAQIKALEDAGRAGEAQVMVLEILEESYGGAAKAMRETFGGALEALRNTLTNLTTGSSGSLSGATQAVNDLIETLNDPGVQQGFSTIIEGSLKAVGALARFASTTAEVTKFLAEEVASRVSGPDLGDTVRMDAELKRVEDRIERLQQGGAFFTNPDPAFVRDVQRRRGVLASIFGKDDEKAFLESYQKQLRDGLKTVEDIRAQGRKIVEDATKPIDLSGLSIGDPDKPKGSRRITRELPDFTGTHDEVMRLMEIEGRARERFDAIAATLAGPMASANHRYKQDLTELNELAKVGGISTADLAAAQADLAKRHEETTKGIERMLNPIGTLIEDVELESALMGLGNVERQIAIATRGMDAEAIEKQADALQVLRDRLKENEEQFKQLQFIDGMRHEFEDFFSSVINGNQSITDSFKNMLEGIALMITRRIAQNWVDQLFGEAGTSSTGSAGGWMQVLAGLFGGSRGYAKGGYTGSGGKYDPAGIVHAGEYVLTAEATRKLGLPFLDALNGMKGYANGGLVSAWLTNERGSETSRYACVKMGAPKFAIPRLQQKVLA